MAVALIFGLASAQLARGADPIYRIVWGQKPSAEVDRILRLLYGNRGDTVRLLYAEDDPAGDLAKSPARQIRATGWQDDLESLQFFRFTDEPAVSDPRLIEASKDKWKEYQAFRILLPAELFDRHFPRTVSLAELAPVMGLGLPHQILDSEGRARYLELLFKKLNQYYPQGFLLKPVDGFNSGGVFPDEKTREPVRLYREFQSRIKPRFDAYVAAHAGDVTDAHNVFRARRLPGYDIGHVLDQLLREPEKVIVQERVQLETRHGVVQEFRLLVVRGQVVRGATVSRSDDYRAWDPEGVSALEQGFQDLLDKITPAMRERMSFSPDLALTQDDRGFAVLEANFVGSLYLHPEISLKQSLALARALTGIEPELESRIQAVLREPNLLRKSELWTEFLKLPEIQYLKRIAEGELDRALSEYRVDLKTSFLVGLFEESATTPAEERSERFDETLRLLRKHDLLQYLSAQDATRMLQMAKELGRSVKRTRAQLGLYVKSCGGFFNDAA